MEDYFSQLADYLTSLLQAEEVYTCTFTAEDSDFVRFNRSAIRQAGAVTQRYLNVDLISGMRHTSGNMSLSGDLGVDCARVAGLVARLREKLPGLPSDPHLLYATEVCSSEHRRDNRLPDSAAAVAAILPAGRGRDLVGIYAAGGIHAGFANSFGQRNWFSSYSYNFDWSLYRQGDKAVKTSYAGFVWDLAEFTRKVAAATEQLKVLSHPPCTIKPGR
jgi:predicted Zn-dependent protease